MSLDTLSAVAAVLLAISLAVERLVTALKAAFPWLVNEPKQPDGTTELYKDRRRRMVVLAAAFAAAWVTSALVAGGLTVDAFLGHIKIAQLEFPTVVVAVLASGGSAWWSNIVAFTSAAKDARVNEALALPLGRPSRQILKHPDVIAAIEKVKATV